MRTGRWIFGLLAAVLTLCFAVGCTFPAEGDARLDKPLDKDAYLVRLEYEAEAAQGEPLAITVHATNNYRKMIYRITNSTMENRLVKIKVYNADGIALYDGLDEQAADIIQQRVYRNRTYTAVWEFNGNTMDADGHDTGAAAPKGKYSIWISTEEEYEGVIEII